MPVPQAGDAGGVRCTALVCYAGSMPSEEVLYRPDLSVKLLRSVFSGLFAR